MLAKARVNLDIFPAFAAFQIAGAYMSLNRLHPSEVMPAQTCDSQVLSGAFMFGEYMADKAAKAG